MKKLIIKIFLIFVMLSSPIFAFAIDTTNQLYSGKAGNNLTIEGSGFGDTQGKVVFNDNYYAEIISWIDTKIVLKIPSGIKSGTVTIIDNATNKLQRSFSLIENVITGPDKIETKPEENYNNSVNTEITNIQVDNTNNGKLKNDYLNDDKIYKDGFFKTNTLGEGGIKNLILNIARDGKLIIYGIVILLIVIMALKLFVADNTDEQAKKLKKGILWATIGIVVMQTAFVVNSTIFNKTVDAGLGQDIAKSLITPFLNLLMLLASFLFIISGIYAFFKMVTAGGSDDAIKQGKNTVIYSIIGFIVIKLADVLVKNTYNPACNGGEQIIGTGIKVCGNITENAKIITILLSWVNSFVFLFVLIMTVYAGFMILTSGGDDEKQKKAKNTIVYIAIGILILFTSFIILKFFINK